MTAQDSDKRDDGPEGHSPPPRRPDAEASAPRREAEQSGSRSGPPRAAPRGQSLGVLGDYEFLEKLGEGGMGIVYKAWHRRLKRVVALKVLRGAALADTLAKSRFWREMEAVGRLDHPNVIRAFDAREIDGTPVLVMEYVEGLTLSRLVDHGGKLSIANACEAIRQAALGLDYASAHGLVHRDIKPSNLMVACGGRIKILDLGLALLRQEQGSEEEVTLTGGLVGTADYMAPEQVQDSHRVDPAPTCTAWVARSTSS